MITVKELIKSLQEQDQDAYVMVNVVDPKWTDSIDGFACPALRVITDYSGYETVPILQIEATYV